MSYGGHRVCHHCGQPGHFIRDCQLRQVPNAAALLGGNEVDQQRAQDSDGLLPAPNANAIVPYRAPANGGQQEGNRSIADQGSNQGYGGYNNRGYNNYNQGYGRTGYQPRSRWSDNREGWKDEKFDEVWGWYSKEMKQKEDEKRAKEEKLKEEAEKKKAQEAEEERAKAKKKREDFQKSIGMMVKDNMKEVCQEVLGKKTSTGQASTSGTCDDDRRKDLENRWRREDAAAREQLEKQKADEMERLRWENQDLMRIASTNQ
ncbi:hypothetical protein CBR_g37633 [Chara braunii]|uniref:CCHC-type domain-containing protein n=1 Tax=Chara braunii TaxID=69332 RepID=A0A388LNG1_CHABU|nr:hypothetical protein CBR_g37633 [Chara braunii]|eukprot:GBG83834.1 hypothetical protein CBR_g37633 [Chara braunii]